MAMLTSVLCTQEKHTIFSANYTCTFIVGHKPRLLLLPEVHIHTPYSGLKIVSFKIFGHCSAQKIEMAFFSGFSSTPL